MTRALIALSVILGLALPLAAAQDDPRLAPLFQELGRTASPDEGQRLGREIAAIWLESGRPDIDLLVSEGRQFLASGDLHHAVDRFRRVTLLAPDFAEGWNKLGHAFFLVGDYVTARDSVLMALELEPRHFLALGGLAVIHLRLGEEGEALDAMERALAVNPHLPGTRAQAERLRLKLEGRDT
ncbi:MAG: tetratricopeptide repeat protein [Pseudomonadota bacterium]